MSLLRLLHEYMLRGSVGPRSRETIGSPHHRMFQGLCLKNKCATFGKKRLVPLIHCIMKSISCLPAKLSSTLWFRLGLYRSHASARTLSYVVCPRGNTMIRWNSSNYRVSRVVPFSRPQLLGMFLTMPLHRQVHAGVHTQVCALQRYFATRSLAVSSMSGRAFSVTDSNLYRVVSAAPVVSSRRGQKLHLHR